jgi:NTE family protein
MSIPIFFEPVRFVEPKTGREHVVVDGGLLSNFPVWLFDAEGEPAWPTFGLRLVEEDLRRSVAAALPVEPPARSPVRAVVDYLKSLVRTMTEAHDRLYIEEADFARTIPIPTLGVTGTDFNLSRIKATLLYEAGQEAAREFLETWGFAGYIAVFRQGTEQHRRRDIAARIRRANASALH